MRSGYLSPQGRPSLYQIHPSLVAHVQNLCLEARSPSRWLQTHLSSHLPLFSSQHIPNRSEKVNSSSSLVSMLPLLHQPHVEIGRLSQKIHASTHRSHSTGLHRAHHPAHLHPCTPSSIRPPMELFMSLQPGRMFLCVGGSTYHV